MGWFRVISALCVLQAMASGVPTPRNTSLRRLHNPASGPEDFLPSTERGKVNLECLECELVVVLLQGEIAAGITYEALVQEAVQICVTQVGMTEAFCAGYVPQVAPILYYIFTHNDVSAVDFCGMVLSYWGCTTNNPDREWSVLIHGEKPPVEPVMLPEPDAPRLKVLHLSDTHMDPLYTPGSNAACPEELCCREESDTLQ